MAGWWQRWSQFREAIAVVDDLDVALATWNLSPALFAALVSFAVFALFMTLGESIAWGVFAAIMVFPAVVWGLIGIQEVREKMRQPPDFDRWSKVEVLSIWMAASLWADRKPTPAITPSSKIYPFLQQLKSAAEAGSLKTVGPEKDMKAQVTRAELLRYAESVGDRPRFLFPD